MEQPTRTYPNITRSLDYLNVLLFWEILKQQNPFLLDMQYSPEKTYTEEESEYIRETWSILYDDYFQLKNDGKGKATLNKSFDVLIYSSKVDLMRSCIEVFASTFKIPASVGLEVIENIRQDLYTSIMAAFDDLEINRMEDHAYNLRRLNKKIGAMVNRLTKMRETSEKEVEKQVRNVFEVIARVSRIVEIRLDAKSISVSEWIAYENLAKEISKAKEQAMQKGKGKK